MSIKSKVNFWGKSFGGINFRLGLDSKKFFISSYSPLLGNGGS